MSLQEKFQIVVPPKQETATDSNWVFGEKSYTRPDPGIDNPHRNNSTADEEVAPKFNQLPPGMEIDNQMRPDQSHFVKGWGGDQDVSGKLASLESVHMGYTHIDMKGDDDQYTGEHMDHFYGVAYGTDDNGKKIEGFAERNNYLDRE